MIKRRIFLTGIILVIIVAEVFCQNTLTKDQTGNKSETLNTELRSKIDYLLVPPMIDFSYYQSSKKTYRDKQLLRNRLVAYSSLIEINFKEESPTIDVLIKADNAYLIDTSNFSKYRKIFYNEEFQYLTATVELSKIEMLALAKEVIYIEAARKLTPLLNTSTSLINADDVWMGNITGLNNEYITGDNVFVGIIEIGQMRWDHETFISPEGEPRVKELWLEGVWHENWIDFPTPIPSGNPPWHATHVAGIAAGDGDNDHPDLSGVAYKADILFAQSNNFNNSNNVLEAYGWMTERAAAHNQSLVVNMSMGAMLGPHDGSTLFEELLNNIIESSNTIFVVAAGNSRHDEIPYPHYSGIVPDNVEESLEINFIINYDEISDKNTIYFEVWGEGEFDVRVSDNDIIMHEWSPEVAYGDSLIGYILESDTISIYNNGHRAYMSNTEENVVFIKIGTGDHGDDNSGGYQISLRPHSQGSGSEIDAYHSDSHNEITGFINGDTYQSICFPGYAEKVVTVASHDNLIDGDISYFSSLGPSRIDGLSTVSKPDIAAPGNPINSAMHTGTQSYGYDGGTSMAAPHVAGAIALLLQYFPELDTDRVKQILQNTTAEIPNGTWPLELEDNKYWGAGKLDILSAYKSMAGFSYFTPYQYDEDKFKDTLAEHEDEAGLPVEAVQVNWNGENYFKQGLTNGALFLDLSGLNEVFWIGSDIWNSWVYPSSIGLPVTSQYFDDQNNCYKTVDFEGGRIFWDGNYAHIINFIADFEVNCTSGPLPLEVTFTDCSGGDIENWYWDFENDGIYDSNLQNPVHIYNSEGVYDVKLKISNGTLIDSLIRYDYITVEPALPTPEYISAAECYIDSDPGEGNGYPLSGNFGNSTATVSLTGISTAGLSFGTHTVYVRFADSDNNWGDPSAIFLNVGNPNAGMITSGEYFIDEDPGQGNGISLPGTYGLSTATASLSGISTAGLSFGTHIVYVRFADSDNNWGDPSAIFLNVANPNSGMITLGEYFIDEDPGQGNGISLPGTYGLSTATASLSGISTAGLSFGTHIVYIRFADSDNNWGEPSSVFLNVGNPNSGVITSAEYFIDADPGGGNGISLYGDYGMSTATAYLNNISAADLEYGMHNVYVRFKDSGDNWGAITCKPLYYSSGRYAIDFDGEDDYIEIPDDESLNIHGNTEITFMLWMYKEGLSESYSYPIYKSGNWQYQPAPQTVSRYALQENDGDSLRIIISDVNTPFNYLDYHYEPGLIGEWIHVTGTWDSNIMKIFVNGNEVASKVYTGNLGDTSDFPLRISTDSFTSSFSSFIGKLDEVRIWNRALTQAEIQEKMYRELNMTNPNDTEGLVGYWDFNEGMGDIAHDNSIYCNDGSIINDPQWVDGYNFQIYEVTADFSTDNTYYPLDTEIQFTESCTGEPVSWQWDFENDGVIDSNVQNPVWSYSEVGTYSISLTVSNGTNTDTIIKEDYITITYPLEIYPAPGNYEEDIWVKINCADPEVRIFYTQDGSVPNQNHAIPYVDSFLVAATGLNERTVINAVGLVERERSNGEAYYTETSNSTAAYLINFEDIGLLHFLFEDELTGDEVTTIEVDYGQFIAGQLIPWIEDQPMFFPVQNNQIILTKSMLQNIYSLYLHNFNYKIYQLGLYHETQFLGHIGFNYTYSDYHSDNKIEAILYINDEADTTGYPDWDYFSEGERMVSMLIPPGNSFESINTLKKPMLLIHGFSGVYPYWNQNFIDGLNGKFNQGDIDFPGDVWQFYYPYDQQIELSADLLKHALEKVQHEYPIENTDEYKNVNVIGHSMGGLVCRYYIQNDYQYNINKLLFLGTPNHGSLSSYKLVTGTIGGKLAEWFTNKDPNAPASYQLIPGSDFFSGLNSSQPYALECSNDNNTKNYLVIAGTDDIFPGHSEIEGMEDGIVAVQSASLLEYCIPLATLDLSHIGSNGLNGSISHVIPLKFFDNEYEPEGTNESYLYILDHVNGFWVSENDNNLDIIEIKEDLNIPEIKPGLFFLEFNDYVKYDDVTAVQIGNSLVMDFWQSSLNNLPDENIEFGCLKKSLKPVDDTSPSKYFLQHYRSLWLYDDYARQGRDLGNPFTNEILTIKLSKGFNSNIFKTVYPPIYFDEFATKELNINLTDGEQTVMNSDNFLSFISNRLARDRNNREVIEEEYYVDAAMDSMVFYMGGFEGNPDFAEHNMTLITPDELVIDSTYANNDPDMEYQEDIENGFAFYYVVSPQPGIWRLQYNDALPDSNTIAYLDSPISISIEFPDTSYVQNDYISCEIPLPQPQEYSDVQITAELNCIVQEDSLIYVGLIPLELSEDSLSYESSFLAEWAGRYEVSVEFICTQNGEQIVRHTASSVNVANLNAPELISPGNGNVHQPLELSLSWHSASNAESYNVLVSAVSDTIPFIEASLADTTFYLEGLSNNTEYYWQVNSENANGISNWSEANYFSTMIAPPILVSPEDENNNLASLSSLIWQSNANANGYHVQLAFEETFQEPIIDDATISDTTYSLNSMINDYTYYWRIRGRNDYGESDWSEIRSFTVRGFVIDFPEMIEFMEDSAVELYLPDYIADFDLGRISVSISDNENIQAFTDDYNLTLSALADWNGQESILMNVFDGINSLRAILADTILVIVHPVNDPPIINITDTFEAFEDLPSSSYDFNPYCTQVWGENDVLTLSADNSEHIDVTINDFTVVFESNTSDWFGTEEITFYLDDNVMNSRVKTTRSESKSRISRDIVSQEVSVTIQPVNDPPVLELQDFFSFTEDSLMIMDFTDYCTDIELNDLNLSISGNSQITVEIDSLLVIFSTPANWFGSEILTFTLDDNQSRAFACDSLDVIITPVNDPPILAIFGDFEALEDLPSES
ncbi:MAG: S8 family serine peptidase [Candidatus Cloacimonetes bacterium]|nr:S8 family serine peptidase [Candidatus Cloacimonadota bacterium]